MFLGEGNSLEESHRRAKAPADAGRLQLGSSERQGFQALGFMVPYRWQSRFYWQSFLVNEMFRLFKLLMHSYQRQ
jgi:hypothetical protein